jgi:hypothetical protein
LVVWDYVFRVSKLCVEEGRRSCGQRWERDGFGIESDGRGDLM